MSKIKHYTLCIGVIFSFLINLGMPHAAQVLHEEISTAGHELSSIFLYPFQNTEESLTFAGLMAGLIAVDYPTTEFVQHSINPHFRSNVPNPDLFPGLAATDEYIVLGAGALYGASVLINDEMGQRASIKIVKAMTYSYLYSHIFLKTIFARHRPNPNLGTAPVTGDYTDNTLDFGNFHPIYLTPTAYGTSFPSFHFTLAFSVGRVISNVYENPWVGYGVVGFLLMPKFESHHHWVSDMVAGSLIGTMIGDIVSGEDNSSQISKSSIGLSASVFGHAFEWLPIAPGQSYGVTTKHVF